MNNKALVHLDEFNVNWETMGSLPKDHLAVVAVLSFAVSEISALARIFLSQSHDYVDIRAIDSASNIQRFVILRSWSSRLFEAEQFLILGGKKPLTKDQTVLKLAKAALEKFDTLSKGEGYEVARDIRNEATNHYSFNAAKKNLRSVSKDADCNMYLHRSSGNCFYPFGEEVMFHARLNRKWSNVKTKPQRDLLFKEWLDWNLSATSWLSEAHANFTSALVFHALGRNEISPKSYYVAPEMVGKFADNLTPVFIERTS